MDPTKCLTEILEELLELGSEDCSTTAEVREELVWKLGGLCTWIDRGGFPPDVDEAVGEYCASLALELDNIPISKRPRKS